MAKAKARPSSYRPPQKSKVKLTTVGDLSPDLLDETVIGTDAGNGDTELFRLKGKEIERVSIPHGRVPVRAESFGAEVAASATEFNYCDFPSIDGGTDDRDIERYGYGDGIEVATGRSVDANRNHKMRYGSRHHIQAILTGLVELGVKDDKPLTLIVPAPPSYVKEVAKQIKDGFKAGYTGQDDGLWPVRPKGAKKWTEYIFQSVVVVPEGIPAYAAYRFSIDGSVVKLNDPRYPDETKDALAGNVEYLDLGFGTADSGRLVNGQVVTEGIASATDATGGIQERMVKPILDEIIALTGASHITEASVDAALRNWALNGWKEEDAEMLVSGKILKLGRLFNRVAEAYAEWLCNNKVSPAWRRGADAIMTVGGGWFYVFNTVRDAYDRRLFLSPTMFPHLKDLKWYELNAYGCLVQYAATKKAKSK